MSRRPARCTEADLKRACKAVLAAGGGRVELLPDGTIVLVPAGADEPPDPPKTMDARREIVL